MASSELEQLLQNIQAHSVLDASIDYSDYTPLDLSVQNDALHQVDVSSSLALQEFIWNHIRKNNAKVAYGGYLEQRGIYNRSTHFNQQHPETERNIHLGLDLWVEAGSAVFSPLDGIIHSFKNNTNFGDYGPTVILKHQIETITFYSLYGHLSLASLEDKYVGQQIAEGEQFATLGTAEVNGDYPPHLHFQLIKDMQDFYGDYPGVTNKTDFEFYRNNCPDPQLLLGFFEKKDKL